MRLAYPATSSVPGQTAFNSRQRLAKNHRVHLSMPQRFRLIRAHPNAVLIKVRFGCGSSRSQIPGSAAALIRTSGQGRSYPQPFRHPSGLVATIQRKLSQPLAERDGRRPELLHFASHLLQKVSHPCENVLNCLALSEDGKLMFLCNKNTAQIWHSQCANPRIISLNIALSCNG